MPLKSNWVRQKDKTGREVERRAAEKLKEAATASRRPAKQGEQPS